MSHFLFTSESVAMGHPDKVCDQISDAILDYCLRQDPYARVACETLITSGLVVLAGQITTFASIPYQEIIRETIKKIGYHDCSLGFDYRSSGIAISMNKQSQDIALGVHDDSKDDNQGLGAGDQGLMFGYACDETEEFMPLPITLAHQITQEVTKQRLSGQIPYLKPDGKAQVTIEYDAYHQPRRVHTVVLSVQHDESVSHAKICEDMQALICRLFPKELIDRNTLFHINPTGRFVIGGPLADCGLTGRKTAVDTYGGMGRHGGGAFSGKDPTKVDRSGAYAARYVAKHILAAKLAKRCEVQISYAIGISHPVAIKVDTFGTGSIKEEILQSAIPLVFDLTPKGIIQMLKLRRPIYSKTAFGGHFGRQDSDFTWEKIDRVENLLKAIIPK